MIIIINIMIHSPARLEAVVQVQKAANDGSSN